MIRRRLNLKRWNNLWMKPVLVDEKLVQEFYSEFHLVEKDDGLLDVYVTVNGKKLSINKREIANLLRVPMEEYVDYTKRNKPASVAKSDVLERLGMDSSVKDQKDAASMDVIPRVLHRILVSNIVPRRQKHGQAFYHDLILVDKLLSKELIDLPHQMLKHMEHCKKNPSHGYPYPRFVKAILEYLFAYKPSHEVMMSAELSADNLAKLGLKYSADEGWVKPAASPVGKKPIVEVTVQKVVLHAANGLAEIKEDLKAHT